MTDLLLGPILRHVSKTSATVWVETSAPCTVEVLGVSTPTFSVEDHHYALVVIPTLSPGSKYPYEVRIDGFLAWPRPDDPFPAPVIRTLADGPHRIVFGSCRAAAPHKAPYTLELDHDKRGRGVDALRAHGLRMLASDIDDWPDVLVLLGDQVYADDPSPKTEHRMSAVRGWWKRRFGGGEEPPKEVVADFEQYTWLYQEAWTADVERWVMSVVPSMMVFDDHDMIDDWNISDTWVDDIRCQPWWREHIVAGLMSYWIYQHLGNLSPERIDEDGILSRLLDAGDGEAILRQWANESEAFTPVPGGYYFSYHRDVGDVRLIGVDSRNGRVLDPAQRQ